MKSSRTTPWLWASPTLLLLATLLVWPIFYLIRLSLNEGGGGQSGFGIGGSFYRPGTWTTHVYTSMLTDRYFWEVAGFTVWLAVVVTTLCVFLAYPTAHFIWNLRGRWKMIALAAVIVPKLSSLLVTIYGLKLILGDHGPLNDFLRWIGLVREPIALQNSALGVVIGKTILILPYTILLILPGLERIDRQLLSAAWSRCRADRRFSANHLSTVVTCPEHGYFGEFDLGIGRIHQPVFTGPTAGNHPCRGCPAADV